MFRLAIAQMTSTDQLDANLKQVEEAIRNAYAQKADLIVFPENALFFRIRAGSNVQALALTDPTFVQLQALVDQSGVAVLLTTPIQTQRGVTNGTVFLRPHQPIDLVYEKIHLFDVNVQGAMAVRESQVFVHGLKPATINFKDWKIGLSICYDVRFSELYLTYAQKVDLILVPSAFLVPTGLAHWHTLLRARAIECQCFLAAPAQVGEHVSGDQRRLTFGHSLVIGPWGEVLEEAKGLVGQPEVMVVSLEKVAVEKVRQQIPMKDHRRL